MQKNSMFPALISEFIGTAFLVMLGDGVVATAILFGAYSGQWQPAILWGLSVAMLIYAMGAVSGAHFNPAVTLAMTTFRDFPKNRVLPYIGSQILGGFVGAGLLHGLIGPKLVAFEAAKGFVRGTAASEATARIFSTYPGADVPNFNAFLIEVFLTLCLVMFIMAMTDNKQADAPKNGLGALGVGALVALLVGIGGPWTMAALNPARDLGPRLWMYVAGWGNVALPGTNGYFWVPILGPIVGAILAGLIYDNLIRKYIPAPATSDSGRKIA
jgi:glycerol uptake facilitator protein